MWRVRASRRVVDEPGFRLVLCPDHVQPLGRLVGQVVGQVVLPSVLALRYPERRVVLRDHGVVLTRLAAEEAPEVIEPPRVRPAVERSGRALEVIGGQVPLAETGRAVAVALQRPDERSAVLRNGGRVARERARQLADRPEPHRVMVAAGQQSGPGGRAERRDVEAVVREPLFADPGHVRGRDRAAERRRVPEAGVVDQNEQDVRCAIRRRRRHVDRPVRDGRVERAPDRAAEVRIGDRQHRAVRTELPHRLGERLLQGARALLVALDNRADQRPRERLLDTEPLLVIEDRDDPRRSRRQVLADLVVDLPLDSVVDELADHPARDSPDRDRRQQRRREQANREPDPAAPAQPLATEVVARLANRDTAVLGVRHQDDALDRDALVPDASDERLEVLRRLVDLLVARDEHIGRCLSHHDSPFRSNARGLEPRTGVLPS